MLWAHFCQFSLNAIWSCSGSKSELPEYDLHSGKRVEKFSMLAKLPSYNRRETPETYIFTEKFVYLCKNRSYWNTEVLLTFLPSSLFPPLSLSFTSSFWLSRSLVFSSRDKLWVRMWVHRDILHEMGYYKLWGRRYTIDLLFLLCILILYKNSNWKKAGNMLSCHCGLGDKRGKRRWQFWSKGVQISVVLDFEKPCINPSCPFCCLFFLSRSTKDIYYWQLYTGNSSNYKQRLFFAVVLVGKDAYNLQGDILFFH